MRRLALLSLLCLCFQVPAVAFAHPGDYPIPVAAKTVAFTFQNAPGVWHKAFGRPPSETDMIGANCANLSEEPKIFCFSVGKAKIWGYKIDFKR